MRRLTIWRPNGPLLYRKSGDVYLRNRDSHSLTTIPRKRGLDLAVTGLTAGLASKRAALAAASNELAALEREATSVQPTVTEINAILRSFGFTGFRLATTGQHQNLYEIVRGDGREAATTLSEGERTFITFLSTFTISLEAV